MLIILIALFYLVVITPLLAKKSYFDLTNTNLKHQIYSREKFVDQESRYNSIKPLVLGIVKKVKEDYKNTKFSAFLYEAVSSSGVIITDESYQNLSDFSVLVKLSISGSYVGLRGFVDDLYSIPYALNIQRLELSRKGNGPLEAVIQIKVFRNQSEI
ncbi:hypothetical protein MAH1_31610 [Sessilibacter sp. MAH1]